LLRSGFSRNSIHYTGQRSIKFVPLDELF
jgi:hypothetical protein